MEIIEILNFHLNHFEEVLEVTFRTNIDTEDVCRESKITYLDISDFGYDFHTESQFINENEDDDNDFDDDLFIDENDILSFLNEYYLLFVDKLPKPELF
jgi:hypothetical protein